MDTRQAALEGLLSKLQNRGGLPPRAAPAPTHSPLPASPASEPTRAVPAVAVAAAPAIRPTLASPAPAAATTTPDKRSQLEALLQRISQRRR